MRNTDTQFGPLPFGPYGVGGGPAGGPTQGGGSVIPVTHPLGRPAMGGLPGIRGGLPGLSGLSGLNGPSAQPQFLGNPGMAQNQMAAAMGGMGGVPGMFGMGGMPGMAGMPAGPFGAQQMMAGAAAPWNPMSGVGMIPHMNEGNVFNPASPVPLPTNALGYARALQMPGMNPMMNPQMGMHHGMLMPGGVGAFKDPPARFGLGLGYPHPDMDRYSSVGETVPAPGGGEAAKLFF